MDIWIWLLIYLMAGVLLTLTEESRAVVKSSTFVNLTPLWERIVEFSLKVALWPLIVLAYVVFWIYGKLRS